MKEVDARLTIKPMRKEDFKSPDVGDSDGYWVGFYCSSPQMFNGTLEEGCYYACWVPKFIFEREINTRHSHKETYRYNDFIFSPR